jgi:hypothetical protein
MHDSLLLLLGKSKTEPRLSGSDPHGAIQIRSFGGKMKIVNLWLMPAPPISTTNNSIKVIIGWE